VPAAPAAAPPVPKPAARPQFPLIQVESIDATARTVSLREFQFGPNGKPLPAEIITIPVSANTAILYSESGLVASQLKVGDTVTLIAVSPLPDSMELGVTDEAGKRKPLAMDIRKSLRLLNAEARDFEVIALKPTLTLRHGGAPADKNPDATFLRLPFSKARDKEPVGLLTQALDEDGMGTVTTLQVNDPTDLLFKRTKPIELAALAAPHAAGQIWIKGELGTAPDGSRTITRLTASGVR
jgi:hypothetical protein